MSFMQRRAAHREPQLFISQLDSTKPNPAQHNTVPPELIHQKACNQHRDFNFCIKTTASSKYFAHASPNTACPPRRGPESQQPTAASTRLASRHATHTPWQPSTPNQAQSQPQPHLGTPTPSPASSTPPPASRSSKSRAPSTCRPRTQPSPSAASISRTTSPTR